MNRKQVIKLVKEVLGDLPQPYAVGTSAIVIERLPELSKKDVYRALTILTHCPSYDKLVIRSDVAFGLDGWTQPISDDRKAWHQHLLDKRKLKKANKKLNEQREKAAAERKAAEQALAQEPVERPAEASRKAPVTQIKRKRRIVRPEVQDAR